MVSNRTGMQMAMNPMMGLRTRSMDSWPSRQATNRFTAKGGGIQFRRLERIAGFLQRPGVASRPYIPLARENGHIEAECIQSWFVICFIGSILCRGRVIRPHGNKPMSTTPQILPLS